MGDPLQLFCPPVGRWFTDHVGVPTEVQSLAWPRIAGGEHVLATAPTGSGKTLTAFLWALNQLLTEQWTAGAVRVLYVSPMRALGYDIRRNLLAPLQQLPDYFRADRMTVPEVRAMTRTGDTPQSERRRMLRRPPEILITTPESLNILLASAGGRRMLANLRTVILDEVHAVIGSKRGVHLMTAVERLVPLCGELQRVALSATVRPLARVARWVGGCEIVGPPQAAAFRRRVVAEVEAGAPKEYDLQVALPADVSESGARPGSFWRQFADRLKHDIHSNRSTLVFANSRRLVEKVARFINEDEAQQLAYSHHGALSREIRAVVEERLKSGDLKSVVATSSLELGIDIGSIDFVELVQDAPSVAAAVQRLGRAGHGVGEVSRGRFYPLNSHGLIACAVLARSVVDGDIEEVCPITGALDVLAQVILSMTVGGTWSVDALFTSVRASDPFHDLPRRQFDLVLEMLAGRFASSRLRSLRPLVSVDGIDGTVRARPGVERLLYLSGGTIPDRGYYHLRIEETGAPIGELDEEFVWERSVGDTFSLGVQTWRVKRITHNDVFVAPVRSRSATFPFWRAEERDRSFHLSQRIASFLEWAGDRLHDETFVDDLTTRYLLAPDAALELRRHLVDQHAATGGLPHRRLVVIEHTASAHGRGSHRQLILHTMWGGRVNRPFADALSAAWQERYGKPPGILHDDDCVIIDHPASLEVDDVLALVGTGNLQTLLRRRIEGTGFFGARFREAAGCALLLPRAGWSKRTPLWLNRQRAKELMSTVGELEDFPLVLEAWRSCLNDHFDLEALQDVLAAVEDGRIAVHHAHTQSPSPFAAHVLWKRTNRLMYEDDAPEGAARGTRLREDLLRELVLSSALRPRLDPALVERFVDKLQRTAWGYAPRSPSDLVDWTRERLLIPVGEWRRLVEAVGRDDPAAPIGPAEAVAHRVVAVAPLRLDEPAFVCSLEDLPRVLAALGLELEGVRIGAPTLGAGPVSDTTMANLQQVRWDPAEASVIEPPLTSFLREWLRYYGPVTAPWIADTLQLSIDTIRTALEPLAEEQDVIVDQITATAASVEVCDRENLERLLRLARREARPDFETLPLDRLPLSLACHQRLATPDANPGVLQQALEPLFGYPAPADLWETQILPARVNPYMPAWLDSLLAETDLRWLGCGDHRLAFALESDRDLLQDGGAGATDPAIEAVLPQPYGKFPFDELLRMTRRPSAQLSRDLWRLAWNGQVTADSLAPVRHGLVSGFAPADLDGGRRQRGRRASAAGMDRWRSTRPFAGAWHRFIPVDPPADPLDEEERNKDRIRLLLDRFGVLFRQLLDRELPLLRWSSLFRALRLMELSGEVVAGRFFDGLPGLQFISHTALRRLRDGLPEDLIWWLNAADPASLCGLGLDGLDGLPRRLPGNNLVYHGTRLVVVAERNGRRLTINAPPDHRSLGEYLAFLGVLLGRAVMPLTSITVETVNHEPAASSAYRPALASLFQVTRGPRELRLSRRY